jgi:hypothetical protein
LRDAPDAPSRAAAGVVLACALFREERHAEGVRILDGLVERDDLSPVDLAWVLVERARGKIEIGDIDGGRSDAVAANRHLAGDADDATASAVAAAAAWELFTTANLGAGSLEEVLTASDTSVSWWRSQLLSWGLATASKTAFLAWSQDRAIRWADEDRASHDLFAAELNADLTGEHAIWREVASLGSRHRLMTSSPGDVKAEGLDALRRSGDSTSLKLAVSHLWRLGPAESVARAVNRIGPESRTRTSAKANLDFWAEAGDLVHEEGASEAVRWCADLVRGRVDDFVRRTRPTFRVELAAADALAGLLPAAGEVGHEVAATLVADHANQIPDVLAHSFARLARGLDVERVPAEVRGRLKGLGIVDHGPVGAEVLGVLARAGDREAQDEVVQRATGGDLHALAAMGDVTVLDESAAGTLAGKFVAMLTQSIQDAARGTYGFGGFDAGHGLALFNVWFPRIADWDTLIRFLEDPHVAAEHKRGACSVLVALEDRLPDETRARLAAAADAVRRSQPRRGDEGIGGLGVSLAVAVGSITGSTAEAEVAQLVLGRRKERSDAAALLGLGWCEPLRPLLTTLIGDVDFEVRGAAAYTIGRLAASEPKDALMITLAERVAKDGGVVMPLALVNGVTAAGRAPDGQLRDLVRYLEPHPAATVRAAARKLVTAPSRLSGR